MIKITKVKMYCDGCKKFISKCSYCGKEFIADKTIFCDIHNKNHYCEECD